MPARIGENSLAPTSEATASTKNTLADLFMSTRVDFTDKELGAVRYIVTLISLEEVTTVLWIKFGLLTQTLTDEVTDLFEETCTLLLENCRFDEKTGEVTAPEGVEDYVCFFELISGHLVSMGLVPDSHRSLIQAVIEKSKDRLRNIIAQHVGIDASTKTSLD